MKPIHSKGLQKHYVYILKCNNDKHYTGMTSNITIRIQQHDNGLCNSTKYNRPVILIWTTIVKDRITARKLEKKIKHYSAKKWLLHQKYKPNRIHTNILNEILLK